MFYIWTLDAHELHGSFTTCDKAHDYAKLRSLSSYQVMSDTWAQNSYMMESLRLVSAEHR